MSEKLKWFPSGTNFVNSPTLSTSEINIGPVQLDPPKQWKLLSGRD